VPANWAIGGLFTLAIVARAALDDRNLLLAEETLNRAEPLFPDFEGLGSFEVAGFRERFAEWQEIAQDLATLAQEDAGADQALSSRRIAEGFQRATAWKGRTLLEEIRHHRSGMRTPELIALRHQRQDLLTRRDWLLEQVAMALREKRPSTEVDDLRKRAASLLAEAQKAQARMEAVATSTPRQAAFLLPVAADVGSIRKTILGPRTALLEFASGETTLYAYVLTSTRLDRLILGSKKEIGRAVEGFLDEFSSRDALAGSARGFAGRAHALHKAILAPCLERLEGADRLILVPDVFLAGLPFEALVTAPPPEGRQPTFADLSYLIDRYAVSYAPASPVLAVLGSPGPARDARPALVLGDPFYGEASDRRAIREVAWVRGEASIEQYERLPGSRKEALVLASLLLGRAMEELDSTHPRDGKIGSGALDLFLGREAHEGRLRGNLKRYSLLHLAAHGEADEEVPAYTRLVLSPGGGEDGFLTLPEVLELDLDADLVVLSACRTHRGKTRPGEGVLSLAWAFLASGARAVIASQWALGDAQGEPLFQTFYRLWLHEKRDALEALRAAKLQLRRRIRDDALKADPAHPFFWAPLIHVGAPR